MDVFSSNQNLMKCATPDIQLFHCGDATADDIFLLNESNFQIVSVSIKVMPLVPTSELTAKVSSVLGREVKSYGKQFLFDGCGETCWNSDQGTPQWIMVQFAKDMVVTRFEIQFQGGFAAKNICLQRTSTDTGAAKVETIKTYYPEDINAVQTFLLPDLPLMTDNLKFLFPESTDMFGRIIVYRLNLYQDL